MAGADELEIDVRVTSDDIPVVVHDRHGNGMLVFLHTLAELKANKPDIPTLEEAIRAVNRRVPVTIEVKGGEPWKPVAEVIQTFLDKKWRPTDFRLGSKNRQLLCDLHKALPTIPKVVIERWSGLRAMWRARQLRTPYICMNGWFVWWFFVKSMKKHGYKLSIYMRENPKKLKAWERHGLYGVVTDHPEKFKG